MDCEMYGRCERKFLLFSLGTKRKRHLIFHQLLKNIAEIAHGMEYWVSRIIAILQRTHAFKDGLGMSLFDEVM